MNVALIIFYMSNFSRLLVYFVIFGCARHSPNKFLKVRLLAMAKFE